MPEIPDADLRRAADIINAAERPMIISGHGVMISGAERALQELAEKADIPVATTLLGLSTIPTAHRLNKGMVGMHGNVGPNWNTNRADVIVAVGMRFDDRVTGDVERYATGARIVHIDIDASEFNKNIPAAATVHGDARHALEGLIPMITSKTHDEWLASFDRCDRVEYDMVERAALGVGALRREPCAWVRWPARFPKWRDPTLCLSLMSVRTSCSRPATSTTASRAASSPRAALARWDSVCRLP